MLSTSGPSPPSLYLYLLLLALLTLCPGCVERFLWIRSQPSGAEVQVNGEILGHTPYRYQYTHYGTREVVLRADGYRPARQVVRLRPPWWQIFPLDFITELMIPVVLVDEEEVAVTMQPAPAPDVEEVIEAALSQKRSVRWQLGARAGAWAGVRALLPESTEPEDPDPR